MINVNCLGLLYCTHDALPVMRDGGGGDVVNVASVAGRTAGIGSGVYNMTKWGVVGFSEALRQEGAHIGVRVTCVEPGFVETELQGHNKNPMVVERIEQMRRGHRQGARVRPISRTRSSTRSLSPSTSRSTRSWCGRAPRPDRRRRGASPTAVARMRPDNVCDNVRAVRAVATENGAVGERVRALRESMASRFATSPSAAASRRRCSRRSSAARRARRWRSRGGSPPASS